jgi:hypothetical protein
MFTKKIKFSKLEKIIRRINQYTCEDEYAYEVERICDQIEDINRLIMMFGHYSCFPKKEEIHPQITDAEIDRVYE